ncbi:Amiloride-sensitive sodium channel [Ancylostoma ceylanicum]|uniref:Amiloride-sensitive sodium channel n=1 Tax=Ancylostoma ceylanicum TaxID=53326 RepID=A0A0D6M692_9BILA|nr:Amiloride-sensitive sodium channel [Ancylostoma ceylanicum]
MAQRPVRMSRVADYGSPPREKKGKINSCREAMFGERARKWAFIFIVAFLACLTIKDVVDLVIEYCEEPKQSDMNIVFNDSMTMPNVTFCMSKQQAWSHFKLNESAPVDEWDMIVDEALANMTEHDSFMKLPWDFRLVMEAYDMIATYNSLERETTAHGSARSINIFRVSPRLAAKRKTFKKWMEVLESRNVTFEEFTQKTGTEVLRRSMQRFQRSTFNEDLVIKTKLRTSWISQMQICFQPWFDTDNFYSIEDQVGICISDKSADNQLRHPGEIFRMSAVKLHKLHGSLEIQDEASSKTCNYPSESSERAWTPTFQGNFFTMLLSHNAENLNGEHLECMSVDFHGRPSSLNRFMEGKGRARDGFTSELCAGMRHEVSVEVRALYQMLENDEPGKACRNVEEGEDSEFDCRSRCRMEMIRDMCKCTALSLSYLAKDDLDKFPLCDYTKCEVDVQKGNYSDSECANRCFRDCRQIRYEIDHEVQGRMVRPDLTLINLNWGSFEYLTMEQQWKYSITAFIAALGGSIGMWLGLSILSLIQGGTYLYTYLTKKVVKEKILKKVSEAPSRRRESKNYDH